MSEKTPDRTTVKDDWAEYYVSRTRNHDAWKAIDESDFRNYPHACLMSLLSRHLQGDIIEIGAGDSQILLEIRSKFEVNRVVGLDYLQEACEMLRDKAKQAGANIEAVCADLYAPPADLLGTFDAVISYGVVEHFTNLEEVVAAISCFAKPGGIVFTLIPNLKGSVYKLLMKKWNKKVYDAHVLYDVDDLAAAHERAGLRIENCRYFLSSNFSMLSWCFADRPKRGLDYFVYVWLTRLSKLIWWFESRLFRLPGTRVFAPYIVCLARKI
jgi:2-polyprenyl-3-methyl-5-hydroxy-6-metoxy-1,4-benzoquinol methylase